MSASAQISNGTNSVFKRFPLVESVVIEGRYLNKHIKTSIENGLRNTVEGICSRHGYVKPGSVSIRSHGSGAISSESGGNTTFHVHFDALVCNPSVGSVVHCRVVGMNSVAAFAVNASDDMRVLEIIIPPTPTSFKHEAPFSNLKLGSLVNVRIIGKRFNLGQKSIICAGQIVSLESVDLGAEVDDPVVDTVSSVSPSNDIPKKRSETARAAQGNSKATASVLNEEVPGVPGTGDGDHNEVVSVQDSSAAVDTLDDQELEENEGDDDDEDVDVDVDSDVEEMEEEEHMEGLEGVEEDEGGSEEETSRSYKA